MYLYAFRTRVYKRELQKSLSGNLKCVDVVDKVVGNNREFEGKSTCFEIKAVKRKRRSGSLMNIAKMIESVSDGVHLICGEIVVGSDPMHRAGESESKV